MVGLSKSPGAAPNFWRRRIPSPLADAAKAMASRCARTAEGALTTVHWMVGSLPLSSTMSPKRVIAISGSPGQLAPIRSGPSR